MRNKVVMMGGFPVLRQRIWSKAQIYMPVEPILMRAKVLWWLGVVRIHEDGDGWSAVFRVWHPLTWVCLLKLRAHGT
jgi:hypothetical protein